LIFDVHRILATLVIPAALPWLIRWFGLKGEDENAATKPSPARFAESRLA
jgi:hypothetical protein